MFHGPLQGLVLAEVECETREQAVALPPPPVPAIEVTDDPAFTGGELAALTREGLSALLRNRFGAG